MKYQMFLFQNHDRSYNWEVHLEDGEVLKGSEAPNINAAHQAAYQAIKQYASSAATKPLLTNNTDLL